MKIVILNLPIPEIFNKYQRGNHQFFAEYIDAIIKINNILDFEIIKLSRNIIDNYNNKFIINEILKIEPAIVCFTSYVWNIERNIQIAKELKKYNIITLSGGPEIQLNNKYLFKENIFDYIFIGEGEETFIDFLYSLKNKNQINKIIINKKNIDFNFFYKKYVEQTNQYQFDNLAYIEIERGCPYNCPFCLYGKNKNNIITIDFEIFKYSIDFFYTKNINTIYLLSPTLNRNKKNFYNYLQYIIKIKNKYNKNINLFGELRAEILTEQDIKLLSESGFTDIEFGVQTLNNKINIQHIPEWNIDKLKKIKDLFLKYNINPMIDFIIGLPDDNYNSIIESINILEKNDLLQYCNFYHLQILFNTEFEDYYKNNNYFFQQTPPYFSIKNNSIDFKEIKKIFLYLEQEKNLSYRDDFFIYDKEKFFIIKNNEDLINLNNNKFYHSGSIIFIDNFSYNEIINFFDHYFKNNSEIFHLCYIYSNKEINFNFIDNLNIIFRKYKNYYDKYKMSINYFLDESFSKRVNILISPDKINFYLNYFDYYNIDIVLFSENDVYYKKNKKLLDKIIDEYDLNVFLFKDNFLEIYF